MKPEDEEKRRAYTTMKREEAKGNAVYSSIEMRFHGGPSPPPYRTDKKSHLSSYGQQADVGYANFPTNEAASMYYYDGRQRYDAPQWHQNQPAPQMEDHPSYQHTSVSYGESWEQGGDNYAAHQAEMERLRRLQEERMRRYEREKAPYYGQPQNY